MITPNHEPSMVNPNLEALVFNGFHAATADEGEATDVHELAKRERLLVDLEITVGQR